MALLDRFARKPQETAAIEAVGTDTGDAIEAIALPVPGVPKVVQGTFRKAEIVLPEEAQLCSGIVIYGRLIKTLAFSTDLYIIRNCNADAVLAVAPFTNQPIITKSLVQAAERPVITGVGGNTTTGPRSVALAVESEVLGASGVMVNIPVKAQVIRAIARAVDIPVAVTVSEFDDYNRARINAGAAIVNVASGKNTPDVVAKVRAAFPNIPIMASGGPTAASIVATINAGAELADPDSLFHFYQMLIALRKDPDYAGTLVYGGTEPFALEEKDLMAYLRRGERTVAVLANLSGEGREAALPGKVKRVLLDNLGGCAVDGDRLTLKGWQAVAVELDNP